MIIIIGNQKGGAGKSTFALVLANFLSQTKNCAVTVIDMDYQQSIAQKFEKAKILENAEPYEVVPANLESYPYLRELLCKNAKDIILIDLPGKLDDDGLIPVFNSADLVICPFSYDEFTFQSTVLFTVVMKRINPEINMVFVPNRIKSNARYEIMLEVNEQLSRFGKITAVLPDRIDFQRVTTFYTPVSLQTVTTSVLEQIYNDYLYGKNEITG
ncbi:ParA family protein [Mucilaginibacter rigui]|uniref:ParA family protein n=1 Tax=Mucilaginibacter rigui TaxID=534635 RepID=A0ABR7X5M2_9SPHI|nr:ParA family protein [Mucilaginibacter rigui]MBD1385873.1 ParA family protein [Mucilaginibacter rigui]